MEMEDLLQEVQQPMRLIIGGQLQVNRLNFQDTDGEEISLQIKDQTVDTYMKVIM